MKPLFIPLKTEYFNAFKDGTKDTEYRIYGDRWNFDTCVIGRPVIISKGYGTNERINGIIENVDTDVLCCLDDGLQEALKACYKDIWQAQSIIAVKIKIHKFDIFKFMDWLDAHSFDDRCNIGKSLNLTPQELCTIDPIKNVKDKEVFEKLKLNINDFIEVLE